MRRYGIVLGVVAVTAMAGAGPRLNAATGPRLRAISTTSGARPAVLIEASEPVAYVSARPDPFTVLVDLRNVAASGYANGFVPEARQPRAVDQRGAGARRRRRGGDARARVALGAGRA